MRARGATNRGLARDLGVSHERIGAWRTGRASIPVRHRQTVADLLAVAPIELRCAAEHLHDRRALRVQLSHVVDLGTRVGVSPSALLGERGRSIWKGDESSPVYWERNVGRVLEDVRWRYEIGTRDEDDRVIETRTTRVFSEPMRLVGIGPGQLDKVRFPLADSDLAEHGWHVRARNAQTGARLDARLRIDATDRDEARYRVLVEFPGEPHNQAVEWTVERPWDGLWRALRSQSYDEGRLRMDFPPYVATNVVELVVRDPEALPLRFVRRSPSRGTIEEIKTQEDFSVVWSLERPRPRSTIEFNVALSRR